MTVAFYTRQHPVAAAFLAYLLVITSTSVWCSWRAIRDKRDWARYTGPVYRTLMVLNGLSGLAIAYIGLFVTNQMALIFTAFSLIGTNQRRRDVALFTQRTCRPALVAEEAFLGHDRQRRGHPHRVPVDRPAEAAADAVRPAAAERGLAGPVVALCCCRLLSEPEIHEA